MVHYGKKCVTSFSPENYYSDIRVFLLICRASLIQPGEGPLAAKLQAEHRPWDARLAHICSLAGKAFWIRFVMNSNEPRASLLGTNILFLDFMQKWNSPSPLINWPVFFSLECDEVINFMPTRVPLVPILFINSLVFRPPLQIPNRRASVKVIQL